MKNLYTLLFVMTSFAAQAQVWGFEFGANYLYANPFGGMGKVIDRGHGVNLNIGTVTPSQRFAFGVDISYTQYDNEKSKQEYTMGDGLVAPMEISVVSYYTNITGYGRWYMTTHGVIRPYLVGKVGYAMYTTDLNVYDPDDADQCEPLDSDKLYSDGTFIGTIGAGAKFDLVSVFKKLTPGSFYFESSVNMTQGGHVRYMDADADHSQNSNPRAIDHATAQFINTQTQIVHEHHVGYLYSNPVQMMELRFGFSWNFAR
ncbi:hypothetical protein WBG78_09375 [Chryseolinea sp. T2]|uniref:hypothetical protein n=1 Tax=Chryseolinea sp. T2 TaxID=3129255 RepID=UPI00307802C6